MLGINPEPLRAEGRRSSAPPPFPRGFAPSLLKLAQTLRKGGASAGMLVASEEISGFQVIANPDSATLPELRQELAALRARLEDSLLSGSGSLSPALDEARRCLGEAAANLAPTQQNSQQLLAGLRQAADHLHHAGEKALIARDLTPAFAQLAVSAATLWSIANRLFAPGS